jgi:hypothetical protein
MAMNTVSREYTSDYARELLLASLERVNRLRKDTWELKEIFGLDIPDEFLEDLVRDIVAKLLDDFSPGNLDSFISEIRSGGLELHHSAILKGEGSHEQL